MELIFPIYFAGTFLNQRAAAFPLEEWASLSVFAADDRLQAELAEISRLGIQIRDVSTELTRSRNELEALRNQKAQVQQLSEEISTEVAKAVKTARDARSSVQDRHAEVTREVGRLQEQIEAQEVALTERRARLHALALEAARLDASAHTITDAYNQANYGLMQVMSFVGAASMGCAENYQVLRTAMSKYSFNFSSFWFFVFLSDFLFQKLMDMSLWTLNP